MAVKLKTWVWVVIGIAVVCVLLVIAMAAASVYYFSQHVEAARVTSAEASREFDSIRTRFQGQPALIELDAQGNFLRSNTDREPPPDARAPDSLHVMAYDPDDGDLVKVTVPFWLLRMKVKGTVDFGGSGMSLEDLKLTVEDLERFGPSLVLDQANEGGERVLVWSQ